MQEIDKSAVQDEITIRTGIITNPKATACDIRVYLTLKALAPDGYTCEVPFRKLYKYAQVSYTAAWRSTEHLEALGYIRKTPGAGAVPTTYIIL